MGTCESSTAAMLWLRQMLHTELNVMCTHTVPAANTISSNA
jgi:hypothetical protein